jgi:hypothetical protein
VIPALNFLSLTKLGKAAMDGGTAMLFVEKLQEGAKHNV